MRILIATSTTGYQTRAFEAAARALGVELVYATDQCHRLADPWRDGAVGVRFHDPEGSARAVEAALAGRTLDGVIGIGDRPAVVAACVAARLGLPWHPPAAAECSRSKLRSRGRFVAAGLPVPWFVAIGRGDDLAAVADRLRFPCVVKPAALSASQGVMRADTPEELARALARLDALLSAPDIAVLRDPENDQIVIEGYVPGREYALEGVLIHGTLHVLAIFDKPDPLDGPVFEETIYVTPPILPDPTQRAMAGTVAHAVRALGLWHGPVHAECRVNETGIYVLEVAARPIGGLCSRALRFVSPAGEEVSFEALLLRHACGESLEGYGREAEASGVMMIPVPGRGRFRAVEGVEQARAIAGIDDVIITAKPGQLLVPLPEGHSYPGFIFARRPLPEQAVVALRAAHAALTFRLDAAVPLMTPGAAPECR
jgi:biotin carboxylase